MKKRFLFSVIILVVLLVITSCSKSTEPKKQVATPIFNPSGGTYTEGQQVTITCQTEGAAIYYTIDGTNPTELSSEYITAIAVDSTMTIKAKGFKDGWKDSEVATAGYEITGTVATPSFDPPGGVYHSAQDVTIICNTEAAMIYYTIDGSEPDTTSILYEEPITISETTTLKAIAYKEGWSASSMATVLYTISTEPQPIEWCIIPAGDYTYGEDNTILNIDYDYEIMKYEVTNAQYLAYLQEAYAAGDIWVSGSEVQGYYPGDEHYEAGNYMFYSLGTELWVYNFARISYSNGGFILNAPSGFTVEDYMNHPVVYVTWFGAWHFADYHGWRLPTEHEWEKAARGMTGYNYPWGNTLTGSRANYWNSGDPWDNGTTPVGFYNGQTYQGFQTTDSPSPFGVYDMAGNVWNWTDSFRSSTSNRRVVRGGGWYTLTNYLQSWLRYSYNPASSNYNSGFRCVRTP